MTYYNLSSFQAVATKIYDAIGKRGYLSGYTPAQLLARNVIKMYEELGEAAECMTLDPSGRIEAFLNAVTSIARHRFDEKDWTNCGPVDIEKLKNEIADKFITLSVEVKLIEALEGKPYDVVAVALNKARADIARGVR